MSLIPVAVAICAGIVFGHASLSPAAGSCQAKMTAFPLDPGSECCTHGSETKLLAGNDTVAQIDQHPWAALIDYDSKKGGSKRLCSGTLISGKYVLTAAHCITGQVLAIATPTYVRLGDYDYKHDGPDCVPLPGGGEDCTEGDSKIEIETIIPHPEYDPKKRINDIGLIRLKKAAPYTDFIRPICLPTTSPLTSPPDHLLHGVSWYGYGIKMNYVMPFINQEKCQAIFTNARLKVDLAQGHVCAGGLEGMDTCKGDGGGALVYENKKGLAELTGIVSFGSNPCGRKDIPSVYTNVFEYLDWIKTNIVA